MRACVRVCVCAFERAYVRASVCACERAYVRACVCACVRACVRVCVCVLKLNPLWESHGSFYPDNATYISRKSTVAKPWRYMRNFGVDLPW